MAHIMAANHKHVNTQDNHLKENFKPHQQMLFVLLTIFTEDNTGQLTRQSTSWGVGTLCREGLSDQHQTGYVPCPQFQRALRPGSTAWAASNAQRSREEPWCWLRSALAPQRPGRGQLVVAASTALCRAGLHGLCPGANPQGTGEGALKQGGKAR